MLLWNKSLEDAFKSSLLALLLFLVPGPMLDHIEGMVLLGTWPTLKQEVHKPGFLGLTMTTLLCPRMTIVAITILALLLNIAFILSF